MFQRVVLIALLCLAPALAAADTLDLGFNNKSFQLGYERPLSADDYGALLGNLRLLYNDDEDTLLGSAGLDFAGEPGTTPGLQLGLGVRLYGGETDRNIDFVNLGIGARASYAPPMLGGLGASASIHYAPKIFSFMDSERLVESHVRLSYALVPRLKVYVGYQNIRLREDGGGNLTIDDDVRIGFTGSF